ncbi:serpin peptidase inhibitor, clade H (heat shock protein 47), member 1, (collagen binding protein 1) L homeolog precursor [Xenopus laevis]|uniref:Serpin H1 n=1 Tax=Xenopus laevis TaxID=8355 RepID=Q08AX2_XENLA|nr:serpin peptidase inhibitor, clade H (heat shock protein 47), member 1, (collagen binding protein 1) L homeolog precursor [Xenopus laevis]AAI24970.1 LOC100158395 protein [Xenopus laevis]
MWMIKLLALSILLVVDAAVDKKPVADKKVAPPADKKVAPPADKKVAPPADKKVAPPADKKVAPPADKKVAPPADKKVELPAEKKMSQHANVLADKSVGLAFNLYQTMAKDKNVENILLSPVVVASSLGLVSMGGQASTAAQAKAVLSADKLSDEHIHSGLAELLNEVSNSTARNVTWKIGNRLYGPSSISFSDDFVKNSKKHYNYEHSKINFRDKRSTLRSINEWASQTTDGKLPEVTSSVEKTDGALIVNAMFFKPHWDERFHHQMVDKRGFMVTRSFTVSVPMMHRTGLYNYIDDETNSLQILEMPLAHKLSSMIFIMPHHVEPLERVEKLLTRENVNGWVGKMKTRAVAVSLPKVSLEVSHDLQKHLGDLGLTEAIDKSKADLSKISGKKDLYLASMFHAAALEWDTEGNPFDSDIYSREELRSPKLFYVDHPFIFLIKDKKTDSILFIGRLVRPKGDKIRDEL